MTLKVVAVLLARVREEMLTSAAGITSTIIQSVKAHVALESNLYNVIAFRHRLLY